MAFLPTQNKCVPYWPEVGSTKEYGPYLVENAGEHEALEYKLRQLCVCPVENVSGAGQGRSASLRVTPCPRLETAGCCGDAAVVFIVLGVVVPWGRGQG